MYYWISVPVSLGGVGKKEFYRVCGLTVEANRELFKEWRERGAHYREVARRKEPHRAKFRVQVLIPEQFRAQLTENPAFVRVSERHFQVVSWLVKGEYWRKYCAPEFKQQMETKLQTELRAKLNELMVSDDWVSGDLEDEVSSLQVILREKIDLVRGPRLNPRSNLAKELAGEPDLPLDEIFDESVDPVSKYGFTKLEGE